MKIPEKDISIRCDKKKWRCIMRLTIFSIIIVLLTVGTANASSSVSYVAFNGYFNDAGNPYLIGSDLGAALFGDDWDIANNIALYSLSVPLGGIVTFNSYGYTLGGADPYFTLFAGGDGTSTFLGSNYDQAFSTGGDFGLSFNLASGSYMIALGVFANMSLAENYGYGSLADGFTFMGNPDFLGNYRYKLTITMPAVPGPPTLLLFASGIAVLIGFRKRFL